MSTSMSSACGNISNNMNENSKLNEEKICECLHSLNVPISINDLKKPAKELMIRIFDTFLKDLQINIGNPLLLPFEAISHFENPCMYEEAKMLIMLTEAMNGILKRISPLVITIDDILKPKPKRTKKILNYLLIFWITYYKKYNLFQTVEDNLKERMQKLYDLKQENEALDEKYNECVEKLNNMSPTKEELLEVIASQAQKINQHEKHKETMMEEHRCLKEKENNLRTQISNLDVDIATMKERINELDQLIISSPEKLTADVQKIKEQIKEIDQKIQENEQAKKEKKKALQSLISDLEMVKNGITKQNEIHNELISLNETVQNLSELNVRLEEEKKSLQELLLAQERKEALVHTYDQKAFKIKSARKAQVEEMIEMHKTLQRKTSEEKLYSEKLNLAITQTEEKIDQTADCILEIVKECKEVEATTEKIKEQYNVEIKTMLENFNSDCKEVSEEAKHIFGPQ